MSSLAQGPSSVAEILAGMPYSVRAEDPTQKGVEASTRAVAVPNDWDRSGTGVSWADVSEKLKRRGRSGGGVCEGCGRFTCQCAHDPPRFANAAEALRSANAAFAEFNALILAD